MAMTRMQLRRAKRQAKTVQAAVEYIQARPGRELSLTQLASGLNITRQTLQNHFWESTGMSAIDYLKRNGLGDNITFVLRTSPGPRKEAVSHGPSKASLKAAEKVWQSYLEATRNGGGAWV